MTIAGLPGIPGGAAMVPALDMFTADCLLDFKQAEIAGAPPEETVGFFFYEHEEPQIADGEVEWIGHISWVRLANVHPQPQEAFSINSTEVMMHLQREIESLKQICMQHAGRNDLSAEDLFAAGFSPFVGIGHSHPGGTAEVSAADHRCSESASAWRSATAPGAILRKPEDAKWFEADFLFAIESSGGEGTLVHFKRGSTRGTWKGNFLGAR